MALFPIIPALQLGLGALGLLSGNRNASAARKQNQSALDFQKQQYEDAKSFYDPIQKARNAVALGYDPVAQDRSVQKQTSALQQNDLEKALQALNAHYRAGGGTPGGSSLYHSATAEAINRVRDPYAEWRLNNGSQAVQRQMQILGMAASAPPGQLGSQFAQMSQDAAQQNLANANSGMGGSLQMLLQALDGLTKKKTPGNPPMNGINNFL